MAKKQAFVSASEFLTSKRQSMDYARKQLANLRRNQSAVSVAVRPINAIIGRIVKAHEGRNTYTHSYLTNNGYGETDDISVEVYVSLQGMLALDEPVVGLAINLLRSAGFARVGELEKVANEYNGYAKWTFDAHYGNVTVRVTLKAELAEDGAEGATCRKVQVGTELKEVPKFMIVCE
jgi:hypothetical protein